MATVYAQIESDLEEAVDVLPAAYPTERGRATKGAALALLAKTALYQKEYGDCITRIEELEALGVYALLESYENLFKVGAEDSTEVIFTLRYVDDEQVSLGNHLNVWFAPSIEGGYYFNAPTQSFVDAFNEETVDGEEDPRLDASIGRMENLVQRHYIFGIMVGSHWVPGEKIQRGYDSGKAKAQSLIPYHAIRYADVLLMKAEAFNETNRIPEAIDELNKVRSELIYPGDYREPINLRAIVRMERRKELGFEFHRFSTLCDGVRGGRKSTRTPVDVDRTPFLLSNTADGKGYQSRDTITIKQQITNYNNNN